MLVEEDISSTGTRPSVNRSRARHIHKRCRFRGYNYNTDTRTLHVIVSYVWTVFNTAFDIFLFPSRNVSPSLSVCARARVRKTTISRLSRNNATPFQRPPSAWQRFSAIFTVVVAVFVCFLFFSLSHSISLSSCQRRFVPNDCAPARDRGAHVRRADFPTGHRHAPPDDRRCRVARFPRRVLRSRRLRFRPVRHVSRNVLCSGVFSNIFRGGVGEGGSFNKM